MNGSLTIGQKVVFGFATLVVLCGLTGGIAYYSNQSIRRNLDEVSGHILPATDALLQLDRDLQQALVDERTLLFTAADAPSFGKLTADHANNIKQVAERWDTFSTHAATFASASMRSLMQTFETNRSQWLPVTSRILQQCAATPVDARSEAISLSLGDGAAKFEATASRSTRSPRNSIAWSPKSVPRPSTRPAKRSCSWCSPGSPASFSESC